MPTYATPAGPSTPRFLGPEATLKSPLKSPAPSHALLLHKSTFGNGSRVSLNEMQPPPTPTGIRAQLGQLLPRHAEFRARVQIHQINNVPFVSGEFGVRWKFKNVQSHAGPKHGLLDRFKARAEKRRQPHDDKGKGRDHYDSEGSTPKHKLHEIVTPAPDDRHVSTQAGPGAGGGTGAGNLLSRPGQLGTLSSTQTSVVDSLRSQSTSSEWTASSSSNIDSIPSSIASHSTILADIPSLLTYPADRSPTTALAPPLSLTPARGMTHFHKLRDHTVNWNQALDTIIKVDIDRETSQILPCPLKLVVMQRVIPDDPNGPPQNPRLGAVYLNLAEYIDKGSVERRYLLKESKINATLKLTIQMEHISGESHYIAPPLPKEEIMAGIANFLKNDAVKKRPRALDLYGPYRDQEELEIDLLGVAKSARLPKTPKTAKSVRLPSNSTNPTGESGTDDEDDLDDDEVFEDALEIAFDVQRLPLAYGTKTTETLIEAIFNPVKITDPRKESPFTVYEVPEEQPFSGKTVKGLPPAIGLGLSGIQLERLPLSTTVLPAPLSRSQRQNSLASDELGPFYDTTSSSAASVRTTSSSSRSRCQSKEFGATMPGKSASRPSTANGKGKTPSLSSHGHGQDVVVMTKGVTAKSTPEGRVVVTSVEHPVVSGIKGWWKRHAHGQTDRSATPTSTPTPGFT